MQPLRLPLLPIRLRVPIRAALLGVTALALVGVGGTPVLAGEIDELKAQLQILQKRIEEIEAKQAKTAKKAEETQKAVERLPLAAPERLVKSGNKKVTLSLSGQVNRVSFFADDGTLNGFFHSDNEASSTRWRLKGQAKINSEWTAGTYMEQDVESNSSDKVTIDESGTGSGDNDIDQRHMVVWIDSKKLGRVWVGKTDTGSNNITQIDLSGTSVIDYSGLQDIGGGLSFRTEGVLGVLDSESKFVPGDADGPKVSAGSTQTGSGVYSQFDGLSRRNLLRYDTPSFAGFKAGVTTAQGDQWDGWLRYKAHYKQIGLKVAAGVAYWEQGESTNVMDGGYGGSISLLHSSGANLTFSGGVADREDTTTDKTEDPWGIYVKPGWQLNLTSLGKTNVSAHYARAEDFQKNDDEFESFGFAIVQNIDAAALELFLFYRQYSLDRDAEDFEDINIAGLGGRVKF